MPNKFRAWRYCVKKFYCDYARALRVFPALNPGRCDFIDCNNVRGCVASGAVFCFVSMVYEVERDVSVLRLADRGSVSLRVEEPGHAVSSFCPDAALLTPL